MTRWLVELMNGEFLGIQTGNPTSHLARERVRALQIIVERAVGDRIRRAKDRKIKDWDMVETEQEWEQIRHKYYSGNQVDVPSGNPEDPVEHLFSLLQANPSLRTQRLRDGIRTQPAAWAAGAYLFVTNEWIQKAGAKVAYEDLLTTMKKASA